MSWWRNNEALWRLLFLLFLGQVVSFLLAIEALTSSLVASHGVNTPLSLSFSCYLALTVVYGSIFLYKRQKLLIPWYWYVALGFVDVQGNYLVNKAYQLSSITSVTLLDCFTIAWAIGLTWYFIGTKYSLWQLFGAALCILGLGFVLLSDAGVAGGGGSRPLLGDLLVIVGTLFYGMSNVGEEFSVKKTHWIEVVSMLGLFATLVTVCEIAVIERKSLESVNWNTEIILAFAGYALAGFCFYSLAPFVLKIGGATLFNLSILTSDMWAVAIRIFIYHQKVDWLYFLSFVVVVIGLVIYSIFEKGSPSNQGIEEESLMTSYQELRQEREEFQVGTETP